MAISSIQLDEAISGIHTSAATGVRVLAGRLGDPEDGDDKAVEIGFTISHGPRNSTTSVVALSDPHLVRFLAMKLLMAAEYLEYKL